jgi:hypothetical protein
VHDRQGTHREIQEDSFRCNFFEPPIGIQIRMVAGLADVGERKEILVAEACNHPNVPSIPFSFELHPSPSEAKTLGSVLSEDVFGTGNSRTLEHFRQIVPERKVNGPSLLNRDQRK